MIKYKLCNCDKSYWEVIIVQNDPNYEYKNAIYYHCDLCGQDFRVEDMITKEELFFEECDAYNFDQNTSALADKEDV